MPRDFGFAVRCEAAALPRRPAEVVEWGLRPETLIAVELLFDKRGRSPTLSTRLQAGQSRRTSDG